MTELTSPNIKKILRLKSQPVQASFCIFCGSPTIVNKLTKKGAAYIGCKNCLSMLFMNTPKAASGYESLAELVSKSGYKQYFTQALKKAREKELIKEVEENNENLGVE